MGPFETWAGVDVIRDSWLSYSGTTFAPFSPTLHSDGWRLRLGGGYGQYSYRGSTGALSIGDGVIDPTEEDGRSPDTGETRRYVVDRSYAEALLGYHLRLGELTAKAFAGAAMSSHTHRTPDPTTSLSGTQYGFKSALELWLNLGEACWTSLDVSYSSAHDEASGRWRAGYLVAPQISIGPELKYDRNVEGGAGWTGRGGMFARYFWDGGEISLAGGVVRKDEKNSDAKHGPYGTLNVLFQY